MSWPAPWLERPIVGDETDRALAIELARRADVVLENYRDGALARRGLSYEQVSASNPGVVYASITGEPGRPAAGASGSR